MEQNTHRIYLDYAAATPLDSRVAKVMEPYWSEIYGNPSALHTEGRIAHHAVEQARQSLANALNCTSHEIIFTSGGTESNNLGIFGVVDTAKARDVHIVTSSIEHPSVLDCFRRLEEYGAQVDYIGVDEEGMLNLDAFEQALDTNTTLVSIMFVNNEIGTIQPLRDAVKLVRKHCSHAIVHTDACQAPLFFKLDVQMLDVDLLSIDAQKIYGPKGVGALYKRKKIKISSRFYGGKQEQQLRPGTENVPGIVGFVKSYELAEEMRSADVKRLTDLRDYFIERIKNIAPKSVINGSRTERIPNNVNVSFGGMEGEFLVLQLDKRGISCASRSACFGAGGEGSPVVAAIDKKRSESAIRFSMGRETTKTNIDYVISTLQEVLDIA